MRRAPVQNDQDSSYRWAGLLLQMSRTPVTDDQDSSYRCAGIMFGMIKTPDLNEQGICLGWAGLQPWVRGLFSWMNRTQPWMGRNLFLDEQDSALDGQDSFLDKQDSNLGWAWLLDWYTVSRIPVCMSRTPVLDSWMSCWAWCCLSVGCQLSAAHLGVFVIWLHKQSPLPPSLVVYSYLCIKRE